jgi:hypothetical protein
MVNDAYYLPYNIYIHMYKETAFAALYYNSDLTKPYKDSSFIVPQIVSIGNKYPVKVENDDTVEEQHVQILQASKQTLFIKDTSKYGTYYRLKKCTAVKISYNVEIVIGNVWLFPTIVIGNYAQLQIRDSKHQTLRIGKLRI